MQKSIKWELIRHNILVDEPVLRAHYAIAINKEEILIFGGLHDWYKVRPVVEVLIFDTRSNLCTKVAVNGETKFSNVYSENGNRPIAKCGHN